MRAVRLGPSLPLLVLFLLLPVRLAAQDGAWQVHASFRQATDITASDEALWVATRGGVYRYEPSTGERTRYTVAEGLHSTDVRAIDFDPRHGAIWIGYSDGVFDRLDAESGLVRSFYDIRRSDRYPQRGINRVVAQGDSLYVATDFGIVVFDARPGKLEVRDTYAQLGQDATAGSPTHAVLLFSADGSDWIAAGGEEGVAIAPVDGSNLQDPSNWTLFETETPVLSLAQFRDRVYVGKERGLATVTREGVFADAAPTMRQVRRQVVHDGTLYGVRHDGIFSVSAGGAIQWMAIDDYGAPASLSFGPDGRLWVADAAGGAIGLPSPIPSGETLPVEVESTHPEGPHHGAFSALLIDDEGRLWTGGPDEQGTGVYRMAPDGSWTSFVADNFPVMQGRHGYRAVATDPAGGIWAASWGRALLRIHEDDEIEIFDETNSALRGVSEGSSYVVVGGVDVDAAGTMWATNMFTPQRLVARTAEGEWISAPPRCDGFSLSGNMLDDVFVDSYGNKWITVFSETNQRIRRGVLVFDSGQSIEDGTDDLCRYFSASGGTGQGLPSEYVYAVEEDRDGRIWVATGAGPAFAHNSSLMPSSTGPVFIWPQPSDRSLGNYLLFGVTTRDLAIDASNRIWLATDNGVYAVQEDAGGGYSILHHFTTENSPLLSNAVVSIAADPRSGRVFMNTDRGLLSYQSGSLEPAPAPEELFVYPNPVRIEGDAAPQINIRGLVEATELRIVTAAGDVIAQMDTRGGQATWDARDRSGSLVPSGMYLVIAVGKNGEGRATGRIAVIR